MKLLFRRKIIKSFVIKEFKQMFRDPRMRIVLFVPPVVMLILFGYAVSTDVKGVSMAVLDGDRTAMSRALVEKFTSSGYFNLTSVVGSHKEVRRLLDAGEAEVFVQIEKGFSARVRSGRSSEVQIIVDGTDSNRAAVIVAYVNVISSEFSYNYLLRRVKTAVLAGGLPGSRFKQNIELKERALFNPDLASKNYFLPGILGMLVTMVAIVMTAMSVVKEREIGTIEQIIVSPLQPLEYIAGKTIPYVIVSCIDIVMITIIGIAWFRVPFNGNFIFLFFASFVFIFCNVSVGLFISTISKTQQQAILSTFQYFLPSILFCGFIFPIYSMPDVIQYITVINPLKYYMTIVRGVFLKGVGFTELWSEVLVLAVMGAALFYMSARRFSERLD